MRVLKCTEKRQAQYLQDAGIVNYCKVWKYEHCLLSKHFAFVIETFMNYSGYMLFKYILIIFFSVLSAGSMYCQPYLEWVKKIEEAPGENLIISDCGVDSLNNIYFNGQETNSSFQIDSFIFNNVYSYILGKLTYLSSVSWVKSINAAAAWLSFHSDDLIATKDGDTYTNGHGIEDAVYIFAGDTFINNTNWGVCHGIYKHDSNGNEIWAKEFLGASYNCFTVSSNENLVICVNFSQSGYLDTVSIDSNGGLDCIIAKYSLDGNMLWAKQYGGSGYDEIYSLSSDYDGNIVGTGYYMSNDFVLGTDTLPPCNEKRGFVAKFTPAGEPLWFYSLNADISIGRNVNVNRNNEIICAGAFLSSGLWFDNFVLENPGAHARYIMKLSPDGEVVWANCLYTDIYTFNHFLSFNFCDIAIDADNNIFIAGWNNGNLYFDEDTLLNFDTINYKIPFVMKFTDNGELEWFEPFTTGDPSQYEIYGLSVDNDGSIICVGKFFGDSLTIIDTTLYHIGPSDPSFIVKLKDKDKQQIVLPSGWSYMSTYIRPDTPNIAALFTPIVSNLIIIKNSAGAIYWPQFGLNLIGNYNIKEGYQIYMDAGDTLAITGYRIRPTKTELQLDTTWQIIPYLRIAPALLENMLSPVSSNIQLMKNSTGLVFWPAWNINAIETLYPGRGYLLKMLATDTLIYPKN